MTDQRFKIVFSGELMPDASLETVKDNLARLFKSEPGKIDALFGGRPVVLKRELPEAEAERYLTALRQAGANAYKEVDLAASLSLVETPDHNPQVAEETPAQDLPPMTCPKCGHEQPSGAECSACGVIIEKYLARQAQLGENAAPAATAAAGASPYTPPSAQVGDALPEFGELNVFTTNGRIGRLRYLGWSMAMTLCFLVIMGLGFLLGETVGVAVTALASIAFIVIAVMIGVQRLHDLGWSGWLWPPLRRLAPALAPAPGTAARRRPRQAPGLATFPPAGGRVPRCRESPVRRPGRSPAGCLRCIRSCRPW